MKLILASGSERRKELLSWLGIPFEVVESGFEESSIEESEPRKLVKRLAVEKARAVANRIRNQELGIKDKNVIVIGADTVVRVEGEVIGKPKDEKDAVRILKKLSGRTHEVYTGVAVLLMTGSGLVKEEVGVERSKVTFRELSNREIQNYVATGEPLDKGGGYAIQMGAKDFVTKVSGSYTNVVGLPLLMVSDFLERLGCSIEVDVSKIIFERTGYWS